MGFRRNHFKCTLSQVNSRQFFLNIIARLGRQKRPNIFEDLAFLTVLCRAKESRNVGFVCMDFLSLSIQWRFLLLIKIDKNQPGDNEI